MLRIRKRQSGRLARLVLEHCRTVHQHKHRAATPFPRGIDPPCVAVIDLDEVPHHVVENGYSTQDDLYGLVWLLIHFETLIAFTIHVFSFSDWNGLAWHHWIRCVLLNLMFCFYAVFFGNGTLTLARRSDTSISIRGCVVLLDQDFAVVLNGSQSVVEAIAESGFNLTHPNSVSGLGPGGEDIHGRDPSLSYTLLEGFCEGAYYIIFVSCWLLFQPLTSLGSMTPIVIIAAITFFSRTSPPDHFTPLQAESFMVGGFLSRVSPPRILSHDIRTKQGRESL